MTYANSVICSKSTKLKMVEPFCCCTPSFSYCRWFAALCCPHAFSLQTFSVPGTIFFSFLAGAIYGPWLGVPLVCFVGYPCNYLNWLNSSPQVVPQVPSLLPISSENPSSTTLQKPVSNGLVNKLNANARICGTTFSSFASHLSSPIGLSIWLRPSLTFLSTYSSLAPSLVGPITIHNTHQVGVMPQTIIAVKAGTTLQDFKSVSEIIDIKSILLMLVLGGLSLLPTLKPVQKVLSKWLGTELPIETPTDKKFV